MYRQTLCCITISGSLVALVQVEMMRAEAVKEELVKFVFLGKVLDARP